MTNDFHAAIRLTTQIGLILSVLEGVVQCREASYDTNIIHWSFKHPLNRAFQKEVLSPDLNTFSEIILQLKKLSICTYLPTYV
jgi:hypothetical protein